MFRICQPPPINEDVIDLCDATDAGFDSMDARYTNDSSDGSNNTYGLLIGDSFTIIDDIESLVDEINLSDASRRNSENCPQQDPSPRNDINVIIDDHDDGYIEEYIGHEVVEDNKDDDDAVVDVISANMVNIADENVIQILIDVNPKKSRRSFEQF